MSLTDLGGSTNTGSTDGAKPPQLVPRIATRRDRKLPLIILGSLLLHMAILLPLLLPKQAAPPPPLEIPVELVREPPPPPKPQPPKQDPPKQDPPKPEKPKQESPKQEKPKPPQPKPPQPKPEKPKPPEQKKSAEPRKPEPQKPVEAPQESTTDRMRDLLGENTSIDPAIALPGASAEGTDNVSYQRLVLSQVAKAKKEGRSQGVPGRTSVAFSLTDKGEVASVSIKTPSGDPSLDAEAIAMVERGAPYPPPPPGAPRDFVIGLQFRALP